jgi:hypothetical protein
VTSCHTSPASTSLKTSLIRPRRFRLQQVTAPVGLGNHEEYDLKPTMPSILGHFQSFQVISNKPQVPTNWVEACWSMLKQGMLKPCSFKGPHGGPINRRPKTADWDWELRPFFGQSPALLTVLIHVLHTCLWRAIFWSQMLPWSQPLFVARLFVLWVSQSLQSRLQKVVKNMAYIWLIKC